MEQLSAKILEGKRISDQEFYELSESDDLHLLGYLANARRKQKHPEKIVTYVIDRNINYTDICISGCKFCAFYKKTEDEGGTLLSIAELDQKLNETKELGGTQVLLQGGLHPELTIDYYEDMVRFIKDKGIHVHGFSPPEIHHFATVSKISTGDVLDRLIKAGLGSIPGGGADLNGGGGGGYAVVDIMDIGGPWGLASSSTILVSVLLLPSTWTFLMDGLSRVGGAPSSLSRVAVFLDVLRVPFPFCA